MKSSRITRFKDLLQAAAPLPMLALGYLMGLLLALVAIGMRLVPLGAPPESISFFAALNRQIACELPIAMLICTAGLARFPRLCQLLLCYRSLLWSYGSVCIYWSKGQGFSYFCYVISVGATLFSFCCLTRLATEFAKRPPADSMDQTVTYLGGCLFYFGLILLTLPLRG